MIFRFNTIKEYEDEVERIKNESYLLMLQKFPVGTIAEYWRGEKKIRALVIYHAKHKNTVKVKGEFSRFSNWIPAIMLEPENPIELRTIQSGSNANKIRIKKSKEEAAEERLREKLKERIS